MPAPVTYRSAVEADQPFLEQVYASTRADELAIVPWTDEEKAAFCRQQFQAQHTYYHQHWPEAEYQLILRDGAPIGRLYLDWREDELRIMDIALLPAVRRQGLGRAILQDLLDEAATRGKLVRIHVEQNNPALRLYERLGFRPIEEQGIYLLMECHPGRPA